jgi:uncharacterized membrane protein
MKGKGAKLQLEPRKLAAIFFISLLQSLRGEVAIFPTVQICCADRWKAAGLPN